jgi:hypothetical protein
MHVPIELRTWALRNRISDQALVELAAVLGATAATGGEGSESRAQSEIRLAAPSLAMRLFRNNVGVLKNEAGTPVRYGLANDSKALNKRLKSGDLIGWRRRIIAPADVGATIAQFVSVECKAPGWTYRGDEHEQAQQRWAALVATEGGFARFATGAAALT